MQWLCGFYFIIQGMDVKFIARKKTPDIYPPKPGRKGHNHKARI